MNLLLWLMLGAMPDYCTWQEPRQPTSIEPDTNVMSRDRLQIRRSYKAVWARCALDRGGKPPILRITANDGQGHEVLFEKPVELHPSLDPDATPWINETFQPCAPPANKRDKATVLSGPVGRRRWKNPRKITVELVAEGPMAPIAFRREFQVLCPACTTEHGVASVHHYVTDHHANQTRFYISVPKDRFTCAQGGGRMIVRRYWIDGGKDEWTAVHPYESTDNFQDKLRLKDNDMFYELLEPGARYCKDGKINMWEVIGLDEYSSIVNTWTYGPSAHIRRDAIEFLKCK